MGLDGSTIGGNKIPIFSSGGTNNGDHLILTSLKYFQSAVVPGGRISNSPPSAIPARYTPLPISSMRISCSTRGMTHRQIVKIKSQVHNQ